ncbi:MAG: hypothetical protein HRT35_11755 [Algicola sp.]|nr:hypothetical protein [Algicola sp.]
MKAHSYIKSLRIALLLILTGLLTSACQQIATQPENKTATLTPKPHVSHIKLNSHSIRVSFSQAMVRFGQDEDALFELPITIKPKVKCLWFWHSSAGITCETYEGPLLKPATAYTIQVHDGLFAADGQPLKPHKQTLETTRPTLKSWQVKQWLSPVRPELVLTLAPAADIESVRARFKVTDVNGQNIGFTVSDITQLSQFSPEQRLNVRFLADLQPNARYTIAMLPGLKSTSGPLTGLGEYKDNKTFTTFGDFKYTGTLCAEATYPYYGKNSDTVDGALPCPHGYRLNLQFSVPLAPTQNADVLTSKTTPNSVGDWFIAKESRINVKMHAFAPQTQVPLNLSAGLIDIFGRHLSNPQQLNASIGDALPQFDIDQSDVVFLADADAKVRVTSVNEPNIKVMTLAVSVSGVKQQTRQITDANSPRNKVISTALGINNKLQQGSGLVYGEMKNTNKGYWTKPFFAVRSPYNIYAISSEKQLTVWVSDMLTDTLVADADVYLTTFEQLKLGHYKSVSLGKTSQSGKLTGAVNGSDFDFVVVEKNQQLAVQPLSYGFQLGGYNYYEYDAEVVWGITDQSLYQGGDAVRFKAFIRKQHDNRWGLKAKWPKMDVYLVAPFHSGYRAKVIENVAFSALGAFDGQVQLPDNLTDGDYLLEFVPHGKSDDPYYTDLMFKVASAKTKEFKISAHTSAQDSRPNDNIELSVSVEYFAGGAFANAQVEVYSQVKPVNYADVFTRYSQFTFESAQEWTGYAESVVVENLYVDNQGQLNTAITVAGGDILLGETRITPSVRDKTSQWVVGTPIKVPFHSVERFVGINTKNWLVDVGTPVSFETIVVDPQGAAVEGVEVLLNLARRTGSNQWQQVDSCQLESQQTPTSCELTTKTSGAYRIEAEVIDQNGKRHSSVDYLHAYGKQKNNPSAKIVLRVSNDKPELGQTVKVDFLSPFKTGKMRVTLTRSEPFKHYWLDVKDHQAQLSLVMDEQLWPGFDIVAYTRQENIDRSTINNDINTSKQHQSKPSYSADGHAKVEISSELPNHPITISTDKTQYRPGEQVTLGLQSSVTQPVEFTVAVIDEGYISNIEDYQQYYDWKGSLYSRQLRDWDTPATYDLLGQLVLSESAEKSAPHFYADGPYSSDIENIEVRGSRIMYGDHTGIGKVLGMPKRGSKEFAAGGNGRLSLQNAYVRSVFKHAAVWLPTVKSDAHGRANATFILPDNLTNFKVMVIENRRDGDIHFDSGDIKVKQPLEIRARLPQQLVEADDFVASYSIVNQSPQSLAQTSALYLQDKTSQWQQQKTAKHQLESTERFTLRGAITANTPAVLLSASSSGTYQDALLNRVPVASFIQTKSLSLAGLLTGDSERISLVRPTDAAPGPSQLQFNFSPHLANQLTGAFDYLQDYPHRCWEQRLSRAVGFAFAKKLALTGWQEGQLTTKTIAQTSGFQNQYGGGMAFWRSSGVVSNYLSAYTLNAFYWLEALGYKTELAQREGVFNYLTNVNRNSGKKLANQAMIVNALAGYSNRDTQFNKLVDEGELSLFEQSQLLQAAIKFSKNGADIDTYRVKKLKDAVKSAIYNNGQKIELIGGSSTFGGFFASTARDFCSLLMAINFDETFKADKPALINTILSLRNRQGHFGSTQNNAMCIVALSQASETTQPTEVENAVTVSLADSLLLKQPVNGETVLTSVSIDSKPQSLVLKPKTAAPVYYQIKMKYPVDRREQQKQTKGFKLDRLYQVYRNKKWVEVDDNQRLAVSEWVRVTLTVNNPDFKRYVALSDPVPGGLEPVSTQLSGSIPSYIRAGEKDSHWFVERQIKSGTSRFYADWLSKGVHKVQYFAQVTTAGKFSALPAKVEAMYDERQYGTSDYRQILVD